MKDLDEKIKLAKEEVAKAQRKLDLASVELKEKENYYYGLADARMSIINEQNKKELKETK
jgi:hypothetical protein